MDSFIDRIQYFMQQRGINNNQMTVAAGLSVGLIGRAIKSKSSLTSDSIEKILHAYPELNPNWLLTGRGEMIININEEESQKNAYLLNKNGEVFKKNAKADAKVNAKVSNLNRDKEGDILERNTSMVSEPVAQYERRSSSSQDNGFTELIRDLVDQLKEQSEEIGALRQENAALKHRLAQIAEDVGNASSVPA